MSERGKRAGDTVPGHPAAVAASAPVIVLLLLLSALPAPAGAEVPVAPPPAEVDRGVGVFLDHCSTCHGAIGPTVGELEAVGVSRERMQRAWDLGHRKGPLFDRWSPSQVDLLELAALPTPVISRRGIGLGIWRKHALQRLQHVMQHGHPLATGRPWPQGDAWASLQATLRWLYAERTAASQTFVAMGGLVLLILALVLAIARIGPRRLLAASLPTPGLLGVVLGTMLVALLHVRLRPAPFDVLALAVAAWAIAVGAVSRRAWFGFGLWCAWVAVSGAALVHGVPRPVDPTFWSYLAAEIELPLLAIALLGISRHHGIGAPRLRSAIAIGILLETAVIGGLLVFGNEDMTFHPRPALLGLPRIVGAFRDPNTFGGTHAVLFGVFFEGLTHRGAGLGTEPRATMTRRLELGGALLSATWAVFSGSRAAQAAVVAAICFTAIRVWRSPTVPRRTRAALSGLGVVMVAASALWLARADLGDVFRHDDVARIALLRRGLQSIDVVSVLFGNGLLAAERAAGWVAPHATVVRILGEHGVLRWLLLGWVVHQAAGRTLSFRRVAGVGAGLLVPLVMVDVAHWRVLALLPALALQPAHQADAGNASDGPIAATSGRVSRAACARHLRPWLIAAAAAVLVAVLVLRSDAWQAPQRVEILATRCGKLALGRREQKRIMPDFRSNIRWAEVFEDTLRRAEPPIAFARTDRNGKPFAHGRIFRFELPTPEQAGAIDAAHALGCVLDRWRAPGPCPRPADDAEALRAAHAAMAGGLVCAREQRTLPADGLPRRRAAGLLGLFVFGLAIAVALGPRRTTTRDNASS